MRAGSVKVRLGSVKVRAGSVKIRAGSVKIRAGSVKTNVDSVKAGADSNCLGLIPLSGGDSVLTHVFIRCTQRTEIRSITRPGTVALWGMTPRILS